MRRSLGFNRGLQAGPFNGVVHGGVTFLLGLMGSNFGLQGGLQAGPHNSVVLGGRFPNGSLSADIDHRGQASLVHMRDTHVFFNLKNFKLKK